jgi:protein SCO1/2
VRSPAFARDALAEGRGVRESPCVISLRNRALLALPLVIGLAGVASQTACQRSEAADSVAAPLPALGSVGPFWLKDQEGRTFNEASLDGRVWVAAFMFTRCPTVCPEMVRRMQGIQQQAKAAGVPLSLVSFSVDPENDTPEVLRAFTRERGLDTGNWTFVTGDSAVIRETAEHGFKIGVDGTPKAGAEHYGITHGTHLVLLDRHRTIRGYYQSSDADRVAALLEDAKRLAVE